MSENNINEITESRIKDMCSANFDTLMEVMGIKGELSEYEYNRDNKVFCDYGDKIWRSEDGNIVVNRSSREWNIDRDCWCRHHQAMFDTKYKYNYIFLFWELMSESNLRKVVVRLSQHFGLLTEEKNINSENYYHKESGLYYKEKLITPCAVNIIAFVGDDSGGNGHYIIGFMNKLNKYVELDIPVVDCLKPSVIKRQFILNSIPFTDIKLFCDMLLSLNITNNFIKLSKTTLFFKL